MDDLGTFRRLLRINKHQLDEELVIQADVLDRISDRISALIRASAESADELKVVEARIYQDLKAQDERRTEKFCESTVKRHPDRIQAFNRATTAAQELAQWQGLHDAWRARGFSITNLCQLYTAQYFTKDSYTPRETTRTSMSALQERRPYERKNLSVPDRGRRRIIEG